VEPKSSDSVLTDSFNSEEAYNTEIDTNILLDLNQTNRYNFIDETNIMVNRLDFITALRFILELAGESETDLASFISHCEFVFSKIPVSMKSGILDAVLTRLGGKAFEAVRYLEINTWEELKAHLGTIFGTPHSLLYLQGQLNTMKLGPSESIKSFAQRIEKIYHKVTHASTAGKSLAEAKMYAQSVQEHALSIFISAVPWPIQIILLSRNINDFEEAVFFVIEHEAVFSKTSYTSRQDNNKNNFQSGERPRVDKNATKCFRCKRTDHYDNECRTLEHNIIKKSEIKKKYTIQIKFCKYCKLKIMTLANVEN